MEQNATSSSKEQGEDMIEETSGYNEQIQKDPDDVCLGSFKMKQTTDPTFVSYPEMTFSTPLSPYEHTEKDVSEPPHDAQPGPVHSPELNHLLSFASLPYEFTEDVPLVGEINVISKQGSPVQGLAGASLWPSEPDLAVHTSELAPAFLLPFSDDCEDVTTNMTVPTQGFLKPDELVFLQTASKPFVEPHQNDLGLQQTPNPISEYPVCSQLLSTLTEWSSEGDLGICGTVELDSSLSFLSFEPTEEAAMLPVKDNVAHSQLGPSELLHPTDMLSANVLELLPNSSQSPSLVADWRSESADWRSEIKLTKGSPQLPHPQTSYSTQALQSQSFQFSPSVGDESLHLLQAPTVSNCLSAKAHASFCQQPIVFPGSNYIQTIQNCSAPGLPPITYLDANHKQSEQVSYFHPSLQPYNSLPYPFMSDKSFNPSGVVYDNQPHLVPRLNLNTISSASHISSDCSPQFLCADLHLLPPHCQINSQQPHPNTGSVYGLSSAELPPTGERTSTRNHLNPKQYENYRLWQYYCNIAKSFYSSTPDLEALACFFIPVIHSFALQHPGLPLPIAVEKAVLEWEKHSNFDRIAYYQMAHKFMEIEEEEMRAEEEPGTSGELTPRKQIPNQSNSQSARSKGYTQSQSPYKTRKSGRRAQKAKEGSGAAYGGQAVKGKDKNLADEAFREYCEIMNGLESRVTERSEVIKEQKVVNDDVEEGSFTEYLNELCSQKKFVKEVAAEIDMAYISSLLSSDTNHSSVLTPPMAPDNAQYAASSNPPVAEACYVSPQTTAGSFSLAPPELHPPLQTGGIHCAPPFWPGLYTTVGTILPRSSFCKIPIIHAPDIHFLGPPQVDAVSHTGVNCLHHQNFVPLNLFQMPPPPTGLLNNLQMSFNCHNATQGKYFIPENCTIHHARNFNNAFQASLSPHNSVFAANGSQNVNPSSNNQMRSPMADCNSQNTLPHQLCQSWNTSESYSVQNEIRRTMNKKVNFYTLSSSHIGQISNDPVTEENIQPLNSNTSGQALKLPRVAMGIELQKDPQSTSHSSENIQKAAWIREKSSDRNKKVSVATKPCAVAESSTSEIISFGYKLTSIKAKKTNALGMQKIKENQPDKQKDHSEPQGKSNMGSFLVDVADRKTKAAEEICSMSQTPDDQDYSITRQAGHLQEVNELTEEDLAVAQILNLLSSPSHPSLDSPPSTRHGLLSPPIHLFDYTERTTPTEKLKMCPVESQEEEAEGQLRNSLHSPLSLALQTLRISTHGSSKLITMETEATEIVRWSPQSPCPFEFSHPHSENKMPQFSGDDNLPVLSFLAISESTLTENMDLDGFSKGWSGCTELNQSSSDGLLSSHTDVISDSTEETAVNKKASEDETKTNGDKTLLEETSKSPATIPQPEVVCLNYVIQEASQAQSGLNKVCNTTEVLAIPAQKDAEEESWRQHLANMLTDSTQSQLSPTGHLSSMIDWLDLDMHPEFPVVGLDSTSGEADCLLDTLLSVQDRAYVIPMETMTESTGTDSLKDIISGGTDKHPGRKETEETDGSMDSKCFLTIEDTTIDEVMDDGSGTKGGESNITREVHVECPVFQPGEKQENAVELTQKTTETLSFIEDKESLVTKPVLLLENEQVASKNVQGSLKNEETYMRPDHLTKTAGVMEDLSEQTGNMNLEVISSILGNNVTTSSQIINSSSSILDSIEERAQNRFVEYQATNEPDIQTKKDVETTKYQKHEAAGSVTRQHLNEDEMGFLSERQQTRSCMETLQGVEGERELKAPDRSSNENTANQKRMPREENGLEEMQQKKHKREEEKDEEKTKGKEVVHHSVTTRSAREKQELAAGNAITRQAKEIQRLAESQRNETRKTEKSISVRSHEERETETQQQGDGLHRGLNAQALNRSLRTAQGPLVLVTSQTRQKAKRRNNQEETNKTQKTKRMREGNAGRIKRGKKKNPGEMER